MGTRREEKAQGASGTPGVGTEHDESSFSALIGKLAAADAEAVASVLSAEPAWLVSAVLRIHDWPWSKRFLQALPPAIRVEVAQLEREGTSLAQPASEFVLRTLVSRIGPSRALTAPATRFDAVLSRIRRVGRA
jgi:hypothetical protein